MTAGLESQAHKTMNITKERFHPVGLVGLHELMMDILSHLSYSQEAHLPVSLNSTNRLKTSSRRCAALQVTTPSQRKTPPNSSMTSTNLFSSTMTCVIRPLDTSSGMLISMDSLRSKASLLITYTKLNLSGRSSMPTSSRDDWTSPTSPGRPLPSPTSNKSCKTQPKGGKSSTMTFLQMLTQSANSVTDTTRCSRNSERSIKHTPTSSTPCSPMLKGMVEVRGYKLEMSDSKTPSVSRVLYIITSLTS